MKAAGGGFSASGQHSGSLFDYDATSLTQSGSSANESMEVCTEELGKRKRCHIRATKQHNNLNQSTRNHETRVYDNDILANSGSQRLVSLSMKTGKRLGSVDHVGPFLANLNQNGRVKSSWNASFISDPYAVTMNDDSDVPPKVTCTGLNQRTVVMQCFRHRMSSNPTTTSGSVVANVTGNIVQAAYPGDTTGKPHILFPNSLSTVNKVYMKEVYPFTDAAGTAADDKITSAFSKEVPGRVSFSAINRPDLEDMSWNLNKLKLNSPFFSSTLPSISSYTQNQVPSFQIAKHRRQSTLQQNNFQQTVAGDLGPTAPTSGDKISPYIYKACLRFGVVEYELMNKNDLGCHVEFIVYKFKKTANLSADEGDYQDPITSPTSPANSSAKAHYPLNKVFEACGQGYLNTVGDDYATENLQGRTPKEVDIFTNPAYPLFPTLRKTVASMQPCVEVMRNKFAMSAGSRRTMKIHLPGELYDPCSIRNASIPKDEAKNGQQLVTNANDDRKLGPQLMPDNLPILDEYSYGIVIAVNGQKMSRFFEKPSTYSGTSTCTGAISDGWDGTSAYQGLQPSLFSWPSGQGPWPYNPMMFRDADNPGILQHSANGVYNYCIVPPTPMPGAPGVTGDAACFRFKLYTWMDPVNPASVDCYADVSSFQFYSIQQGYYYGPKRGCGFVKWPSQQGAPVEIYRVYYNPSSTNLQFDPSTCPELVCIGSNASTLYFPQPLSFFFNDYYTGATGVPAAPPIQYPMGDNYGAFHVDYCATYTEHIGACVYKEPNERNLYDCGQPDIPTLEFGTASASIPVADASKVASEHGRIILPAAAAVRGTGSSNYDGTTWSQSQSGSTVGGANNGNPT